MTLVEINKRLAEISVGYPMKLLELANLEHRYNIRFWYLLLHSGMATIVAKEADANMICNEEGILEPLQILRGEVKGLWHEEQCLLAISANVRGLKEYEKDL